MFIDTLLSLLVVHALADYPLQGDFLAKAKNETAPIPGVPWWQALTAHSFIHGGGVALITGSWTLGVIEVIAHFFIDRAKCRGRISFNTDQTLHVACKVVYAALVWAAA